MLDRDAAVLVIVDIQEKLLPSVVDAGGLVHRTRRLIQGVRLLGVPILVTEQYPQGLGHTESDIVAVLEDGYRPIEKAAMSTMGEPNFVRALEATGRRQILLCGIEAHVCVYQTAHELRGADYEVHLVADCVSSREARDVESARQRMLQLGCCPTTHEMAVFEILRVSGTPEFKQWVQMIR